MMSIVLMLSLLSQSPGELDSQQQKEWLLANLITSLGFDAEKIGEVQKKLDQMSPSQIRILVQVYKTKLEERNQMLAAQRYYYEQSILAQAQLNLDRSRAYRDHLKREYDYSVVVKKQEIELMRRATVYQNQIQNWNRPHYYHRWR
jgi:hypothetical protein